MDCLRQYACLVIKPIATYNFDTVVNCRMVGQAALKGTIYWYTNISQYIVVTINRTTRK